MATAPRLTAEQRRALQLLAGSRHGASEELLVHGHGFSRRQARSRSPRCGLRRRGGGRLRAIWRDSHLVRIHRPRNIGTIRRLKNVNPIKALVTP